MKKISVIITTHGRLRLLKTALKSVQQQSYPDIEIIIVDDCSKDGTREWFETEKKKNVKYIYIDDKHSKGGNHARNVGIKASTGEYIAFLDDDDMWEKDKIEKQIKLFANPEIGLVYCGHTRLYENGDRIIVHPDNNFQGDLSKKVFLKIFCTTSMIMVRRKIIEEVGFFDEQLRFWQEYDFVIRICQQFQVAYVSESLVTILHSTSDPTRLSSKIDGWFHTVEYINEKYSDFIDNLSFDEKKKRWIMIYNDAAIRCLNSGDRKKHKYYLRKAYETDPTVKRFLKYYFNIPNKLIDKIRNNYL